MSASFTGAIAFGLKKILISCRNRVSAVIAHNKLFFMKEVVTFFTEPLKPVYFSLNTLALNYK
jgi:hypothetical protein